MSDNSFLNLPPNLRAYALAGLYLQSFALMEGNLNATIGAALKLSSEQRFILTKNLQLRSKLMSLRTLVSVAPLPPEKRAAYDKLLQRIGTISDDRNMVAHDVFGPDDQGDGIEFLVTKASGKLTFPDVRWSVQDTLDKSEELGAISEQLKKLKSDLSQSDLIRALARHPNALASLYQPPIDGLPALGSQGEAPPQPPSDPSSTPQETTDAKAPETLQEPRE